MSFPQWTWRFGSYAEVAYTRGRGLNKPAKQTPFSLRTRGGRCESSGPIGKGTDALKGSKLEEPKLGLEARASKRP